MFPRLKYNAPFSLSFALFCATILALDLYVFPGVIGGLFTVYGNNTTNWADANTWFRLFSHAAGHSGWDHYLANFSFILLLGPILEEKYSSVFMLIITVVTALATGLVNSLLFSTALTGASGIVFMMIILASFTNIRAGEIPLTFVAILLIYLGKEVLDSFRTDNISQFAHIFGGIAGAVVGFFTAGFRTAPVPAPSE